MGNTSFLLTCVVSWGKTAGGLGLCLWLGDVGTGPCCLALGPGSQRAFSLKTGPRPPHPDWLQSSGQGTCHLAPSRLSSATNIGQVPKAFRDQVFANLVRSHCSHYHLLASLLRPHCFPSRAHTSPPPGLCPIVLSPRNVLWLPMPDSGDQGLGELSSSPAYFTSWPQATLQAPAPGPLVPLPYVAWGPHGLHTLPHQPTSTKSLCVVFCLFKSFPPFSLKA